MLGARGQQDRAEHESPGRAGTGRGKNMGYVGHPPPTYTRCHGWARTVDGQRTEDATSALPGWCGRDLPHPLANWPTLWERSLAA